MLLCVALPYVVLLNEFSFSVLFGGTACIWLAGCELILRQVGVSSVMAADSVAAAGGRAGIMFWVELVIPWDAPEAVINLIWCGCSRTWIQCVQRPEGGSGVLVRGGVPTVIK